VSFVVIIFSVERIVILGCAGSGKTTLARQLGKRTGAPVICLDTIWQPHWDENDVPAFRALIKNAHASERWISDGNLRSRPSISDYRALPWWFGSSLQSSPVYGV
jgi:hypothetical protein